MLIENGISPKHSIYYLGSIVINLYNDGIIKEKLLIEDMYKIFYSHTQDNIGITKFIYVLDRLYILGVVTFSNSYIQFTNDNN